MKQFCYDYARTQDVLVLPALDLSGTLRQPSCTDSMREGQAAQDLYSTALCRLTVSRCCRKSSSYGLHHLALRNRNCVVTYVIIGCWARLVLVCEAE